MATSLFIPKENQLTNQYRFIYPPSVFLCTKNVTLRFPFRPKKYASANLTYHNFEYYYSEFCIEHLSWLYYIFLEKKTSHEAHYFSL
jgi:hypothetical protein